MLNLSSIPITIDSQSNRSNVSELTECMVTSTVTRKHKHEPIKMSIEDTSIVKAQTNNDRWTQNDLTTVPNSADIYKQIDSFIDCSNNNDLQRDDSMKINETVVNKYLCSKSDDVNTEDVLEINFSGSWNGEDVPNQQDGYKTTNNVGDGISPVQKAVYQKSAIPATFKMPIPIAIIKNTLNNVPPVGLMNLNMVRRNLNPIKLFIC